MATCIVYDTETTGIPLYGEPSEDPRQPHIVQIGALLVDVATREVLDSLDVLVKPEGWVIPADMTAIHGISMERAMADGEPEPDVLRKFMAIHARADFRVGHNESFDARIVRIACKRYEGDAAADNWKSAAAKCTMQMSRPILALPRNKPPTLSEAHLHFTGKEIERVHTALADAKACMAVFFAMQ